MRTFIAVNVKAGKALLQAMADLKNELSGEQLKWVGEQNLHLTLKFVGETSVELAKKIRHELMITAQKQAPFSFSLHGLGYFKSGGIPKVLFASVLNGEPPSSLAGEIDAQLSRWGIEKEKRNFNPHLTLARIKNLNNKKKFHEASDKYREKLFQTVVINEIVYYQSRLTPNGPDYTELARFSLSG